MISLASALQSALDPAARESRDISNLWWIFFWVTVVIFLLVSLWLIIAIRNARWPNDSNIEVIGEAEPGIQSRATRIIAACVAATVLTLFALLVLDFFTGNAIYAKPDPNALAIRVTGHQWWWDVEYQDPQPSETVKTANEIHVPVGKTVKFELQSTDVIHSFWVPNMHGKKDLVPGIPTTTWFVANRAGEFRGQCAEYCGEEHALMRLVFVAEPESDFSKWLAAQKKSAAEPVTDSQRHGRDIFMSRQCTMCHAVEGTNARAVLGPDLTHVASRKFLGAGAIPNTRDKLLAWIYNPQHDKPGVRMPQNEFSKGELEALVDYLENLK